MSGSEILNSVLCPFAQLELTLEIRGRFIDVLTVIHLLGTLISMWSSSALCLLPSSSPPELPFFAPSSVYLFPQTISLFPSLSCLLTFFFPFLLLPLLNIHSSSLYPHFSIHLSFHNPTMNQRKRDGSTRTDEIKRHKTWDNNTKRQIEKQKEKLDRDLSVRPCLEHYFLICCPLILLFMEDGDANYSWPTGRSRAVWRQQWYVMILTLSLTYIYRRYVSEWGLVCSGIRDGRWCGRMRIPERDRSTFSGWSSTCSCPPWRCAVAGSLPTGNKEPPPPTLFYGQSDEFVNDGWTDNGVFYPADGSKYLVVKACHQADFQW